MKKFIVSVLRFPFKLVFWAFSIVFLAFCFGIIFPFLWLARGLAWLAFGRDNIVHQAFQSSKQ